MHDDDSNDSNDNYINMPIFYDYICNVWFAFVGYGEGPSYITGISSPLFVLAILNIFPLLTSCHQKLQFPWGCWEEGKCLVFDDSFEHEVWLRLMEFAHVCLGDKYGLLNCAIKGGRRLISLVSAMFCPQVLHDGEEPRSVLLVCFLSPDMAWQWLTGDSDNCKMPSGVPCFSIGLPCDDLGIDLHGGWAVGRLRCQVTGLNKLSYCHTYHTPHNIQLISQRF